MIDMSEYTYMVRHNPNCPFPFEVRTGGDAFMVDPTDRRNLVSYGKTLDEAMAAAATKIEDHERSKRASFAARERQRRHQLEERRFAGILWA